MKKWYSRASSERTNHYYDYWHDWIGLSENAPSKITRPEELETWARLSTTYNHYERDEYDLRDASYLKCSGRWVEDISDDGEVTIKTASVLDESETSLIYLKCVHETEYFQL